MSKRIIQKTTAMHRINPPTALVFLLAILLLPAVLFAQQPGSCCQIAKNRGQQAFDKKDYATALSHWTQGKKCPDASKCPDLDALIKKAKNAQAPAAKPKPVTPAPKPQPKPTVPTEAERQAQAAERQRQAEQERLRKELENNVEFKTNVKITLNKLFHTWAERWSVDRYIDASNTISSIVNENGSYKIVGTFDVIRDLIFMKQRITVNYTSIISADSTTSFSVKSLCYQDASSGMEDCF